MDEIRQQISALKLAVARPPGKTLPGGDRTFDVPSPITDQLIHSGFGPDLAQEIASAVGTGDGLARELVARIPVADFPEVKTGRREDGRSRRARRGAARRRRSSRSRCGSGWRSGSR